MPSTTTLASYLPQVEECLRLLGRNFADGDALRELQRLTQGLRSDTASAGLNDASEIAQSAEELAEAIASGAMPMDEEVVGLFQDALSQLAKSLPGGGAPAATSVAAPEPATRMAIDVPPELVAGFLDEAIELLDRAEIHLKRYEKGERGKDILLEIRRAVHTLKGSAAMVGMKALSKLGHAMEDVLDELRDAKRQPSAEVHALFHATLDAVAESVENRGAEPAQYADLLARYRELRGEAPPPAIEPVPERAEQAGAIAESSQSVRVPLDHLDSSLRGIGEFSVIRAGWDQQLAAHRRQLDEFALAVRRCQRIANRLETEYAVYSPGETAPGLGELWAADSGRSEFDALEFDRYTEFHLLSRDLSETASDLVTIEAQLSSLASEFDGTRGRFARSTAELQDNIIRMRMAPAGILRARLERTVRTAAATLGKAVEFRFEGANTELDKAAIESLAAPLEHVLRNAVAHGIEDAETRAGVGKPASGLIVVSVVREGSNAVFQVSDDGGGVDEQRVRQIAVRNGLATPAQVAGMQGKALHGFLFEPGFSTADHVTEISGRGVGLDIVRSTVEGLKGTVAVESIAGLGTTFTLRLPLSQAILRVLFVEAANQTFALPLANVLRAGKAVVLAASGGGERIRQVAIEEVLHLSGGTPQARSTRPAVVLDCGSEQIALLVNRILEIREVLVNPPSGLLKKAPAVAGTTTLVDGSVVLVLQPPKLSRASAFASTDRPIRTSSQPLPRGPLEVLVIDDSVSVRRIVTNTLRKQGWNVASAKDGLEALEVLHSMPRMPDAILVDVEMPRMDGYDFTVALRSEAHHAKTPVIMLTSRGGDKHRRKAFDVGVTDFLVKPYAEETLVATIRGHALAG